MAIRDGAGRLPEADWKVFRELQKVALDRFCQRVLTQLARIAGDPKRSHHERYLAIYRLLQKRDRELARGFDDPKRSRMIQQLATIHSLRLLEPGDLARFTEETRQTVKFLVEQL